MLIPDPVSDASNISLTSRVYPIPSKKAQRGLECWAERHSRREEPDCRGSEAVEKPSEKADFIQYYPTRPQGG